MRRPAGRRRGSQAPGDPQRAAAAIRNVSDIGSQALGDTRRLLGVLHTDRTSGGLGPQPDVGQVDGLLGQVRANAYQTGLVRAGWGG